MFEVYGEIATEMSLEDLADLLRGGAWQIECRRYVVQLNSDQGRIVLAPLSDGGFILEDGIDADDPLEQAKLVSSHLTERRLRHRFEVYDRGGEMVAYLHWDWPLT